MIRNDPDRDWERFGAENPYYAMINTEAYRSDRLTDELVREVMDTGEARIDYLLHFAEQHCGPVNRGRALEFGCGVGRLLLPLGRRFDKAVGIDVSPSMLREAAENCRRQDARNVELLASDDQLSLVGHDFDFILSYLVLQHIPTRRGERIIGELVSRLAPGGVAALHVTVSRSSPRWRHAVHLLRRQFLPLHCLANLAAGMRWNEPMMQTNLYDLDRIADFASAVGAEVKVTLPVQYADHVGHVVFLRRRPLALQDERSTEVQPGRAATSER